MKPEQLRDYARRVVEGTLYESTAPHGEVRRVKMPFVNDETLRKYPATYAAAQDVVRESDRLMDDLHMAKREIENAINDLGVYGTARSTGVLQSTALKVDMGAALLAQAWIVLGRSAWFEADEPAEEAS